MKKSFLVQHINGICSFGRGETDFISIILFGLIVTGKRRWPVCVHEQFSGFWKPICGEALCSHRSEGLSTH